MMRTCRFIITAAVIAMLCLAAFARADNGRITGTVYLPGGEPAVNARVRLFHVHCPSGYGLAELAEAAAGTDGGFAIDIPEFQPPAIIPFPGALTTPPGLYLTADLDGYSPAIHPVGARRLTNYALTLDSAATAAIRVVNLDGNPVAGAYIWASNVYRDPADAGGFNPGELPLTEHLWNAETNENGVAVISLPRGVNVQISAVHPETGLGQTMIGQPRQAEQLVQEETIILQGRVVNIRGRILLGDEETPGEGMVVTFGIPRVRGMITTAPRLKSVAVADEDGRFEIAILIPRGMEQTLERMRAVIIALDPSYEPEFADTLERLPADWLTRNQEARVTMRKGVTVTGRVVNETDERPMPGTVIQATPSAPELRAVATLYRLADASGAFHYRMDVDGALWRAQFPPTGYVNVGRFQTVATVLNRPAEVELRIQAVREAPGAIKISYPDGRPAEEVALHGWQSEIGVGIPAGGDRPGLFWLPGMAAGRPAILHAVASDNFSAHLALNNVPDDDDAPIELTLREGRRGAIHFLDENNNPVGGGTARLFLMGPDDRTIIAPLINIDIGENGRGEIHGLQPNARYGVTISPPGRLRPAADQRGINIWQIAAAEAAPAMNFRLTDPEAARAVAVRGGGRQTAPQPTGRTRADYDNEFGNLERSSQTFADAALEHLIWLADRDGRFIAMADSESMEIRRFERLFGFDQLIITGMAFTEEKVWLGTDRGLVSWDRRHQYWGRYAIGGFLIESYVVELELVDHDTLRITIGRENEEPRRFEFHIDQGRWKER